MSDAVAEFPLDETVARVERIMALIPSLNRRLIEFRTDVHIEASESAQRDRELMRRADEFVEEPLLNEIMDGFSKDQIHSEEAGTVGEDGEFSWWVDPVDGTRNFIHGLPMYCIVIGICFRDSPVAGIVSMPGMREVYRAVLGDGAFRNDNPIEVSAVDQLKRSLVSSGLPFARRDILPDIITDISAFILSGAGLRRTGSTALDLCWVADGRTDAMWERGVSPHDICGPSLIVREAGGIVTNFEGHPFDFHFPEIVAGNPSVHGAAIETLRQAHEVEGIN